MEEKLQQINWINLKHAQGAAGDIPTQLLRLRSTDIVEQEMAIDALFQTLYYKGSIYEATAHAVPFLIELLNCEKVQLKYGVLDLLEAIASVQADSDLYPTHEILEAQIQEAHAYIAQSRTAVKAGFEQYEPFLYTGVIKEQIFALKLMSHFPDKLEPMLADLMKLCYLVKPLVRVSIIVVLEAYIEKKFEVQLFFRYLMFDMPQDTFSHYAAVAASYRFLMLSAKKFYIILDTLYYNYKHPVRSVFRAWDDLWDTHYYDYFLWVKTVLFRFQLPNNCIVKLCWTLAHPTVFEPHLAYDYVELLLWQAFPNQFSTTPLAKHEYRVLSTIVEILERLDEPQTSWRTQPSERQATILELMGHYGVPTEAVLFKSDGWNIEGG